MVISQSKAVKKKLMAAIAMLLIACIMLITASYAWFTLSTAPEVTGITTTVGANGNLEMALADKSTWADPDSLISTVVGNSLDQNAGHNANISWGNLVDLSLEQYGFSEMMLNPAILNISSEAGLINTSSMIQTPSYGTDGRVIELVQNSLTASYDATAGEFVVGSSDEEPYGVRAIGNASALTDRQMTYRSAKASINGAASSAQSAAAKSLNANGSALAQIIIDKALDGDNATFDIEDVNALDAVVTDLEAAVVYLNDGLDAAILGYVASAACQESVDADAFATFKAALESGYTVSGTTLTAGGVSVTIPENIADMFAVVAQMESDLEAAATAVDTMKNAYADETTTYTWTEINGAVKYLVDADAVTVNGYTADEIKGDIDGFASNVLATGSITVEMQSGAGVYADIADFCGDYSSNVDISVVYGTMNVNTTAVMTTATSVNPTYFETMITAITGAGSPASESESDEDVYLTETYAYVIDLYFRTNAASSNLLLQSEGIQRIYSDSTNEETMGAGSTMTFESSSTSFDSDDVKNLMSNIRVAFVDDTNTIIAFGALDPESFETTGSEVSADICLYEYSIVNAGTAEAPIWTVSINSEDTDGDNVADSWVKSDDQAICALAKNTAVKLSAVVYLDGETITNADVANAATSMTGSMNLQFASDADLYPMENGELK